MSFTRRSVSIASLALALPLLCGSTFAIAQETTGAIDVTASRPPIDVTSTVIGMTTDVPELNDRIPVKREVTHVALLAAGSRPGDVRFDEAGEYWNHAGGLSPILKAKPWIGPQTVCADFGAGNGLQALLLQILYPHERTVQIEISKRAVEIGRGLQEWLRVPRDRVEWIVDDVRNVPATGYGFIYLYRPVRPEGPGRDFYTRFAREVESDERPPVIFSIADCLHEFLSDRYEVVYGDGHLTCFKPKTTG